MVSPPSRHLPNTAGDDCTATTHRSNTQRHKRSLKGASFTARFFSSATKPIPSERDENSKAHEQLHWILSHRTPSPHLKVLQARRGGPGSPSSESLKAHTKQHNILTKRNRRRQLSRIRLKGQQSHSRDRSRGKASRVARTI